MGVEEMSFFLLYVVTEDLDLGLDLFPHARCLSELWHPSMILFHHTQMPEKTLIERWMDVPIPC